MFPQLRTSVKLDSRSIATDHQNKTSLDHSKDRTVTVTKVDGTNSNGNSCEYFAPHNMLFLIGKGQLQVVCGTGPNHVYNAAPLCFNIIGYGTKHVQVHSHLRKDCIKISVSKSNARTIITESEHSQQLVGLTLAS